MKKLFLTAVFMFALSQVSFAATSFADLLRQEKASSSFIPKIEIQSDDKITTIYLYSQKDCEDKEVWTSDYWVDHVFKKKEDTSHSWWSIGCALSHYLEEAKQSVSEDEYGRIEILDEMTYPTEYDDECKTTRQVDYKSIDTIHNVYCSALLIEEICTEIPDSNSPYFKYECTEYHKEVYNDNITIKADFYRETDTCYEKWDD